MRLVIVRHGKAKPDSESGLDFDRPLRGRGQRQAAFVGERLAGLEPRVAAVVSSPAVRARETAEILAGALGLGVEFDDRLGVDAPVSGLLELVADRGALASLVLVGHNPQLEHAVAVLNGGAVGAFAPVRTGEAVVFEVDPVEPLESGAEVDRFRLEDL